MAKDKNKVETAQEKIARLQAEMLAAQAEAQKEVDERNNEIADKVRELTKTFGVATLGDVISLIKQVEKGTLGKVDATARSYVRLTDEQKATIKERLAKGGAGNQVSQIAAEFNVSVGTIYGMKKEKVEATPAVVEGAAATA